MVEEIPESEYRSSREIEGSLITAITCAASWPAVFTKSLATYALDKATGATHDRGRRSLMYRISENMDSSVGAVDDVVTSLKSWWNRL